MAVTDNADTTDDTESRWPTATAYVRVDDDGIEAWHTDRSHRESREYTR